MSQPDESKDEPTIEVSGPPLTTDSLQPTLPSQAIEQTELSWDNAAKKENERIGRYRLIGKLGQGTYGVVFRAQDEVLHRFVALKLLTRFEDAKQIDAWLAEARVLAGLDHPSIVPVFDVGKTSTGQPFIVSKLIDGGSLSQRYPRGRCSVSDAVKVVGQLANALDYLHRRGVMHRDVKPGNILTTSDGDAVLADFGLALSESSFGKGARFVGTPAYMSPEQARFEGHRVDGRSDIYSLGVVFYELLTGSRPFRAENQEDLLDCIRNVEVRPLRQLNAAVPRELERICLKALSKKISDRYSTAKDLVDDLLNWDSKSALLNTASTPTATFPPALDAKPASTIAITDTHPSAKSLELETIAVVPHGLRPFDAGDNDFFNYLLPGARDRNGVPDSVSFWSSRILSRSPSEAFRVGVLLGPSGSGKSSLMRAGVLPLVSEATDVVFVEAKPDQLESNLAKQISHKLGREDHSGSLRELLTSVRQQTAQRNLPKLLLVIDQFEQWLNYHRDDQLTELHEALRQCDGANVQAILLVRDDFMLGISSFMDQLEEPLLQNQNFATVEPFGITHSQRVLAAFGRAYGTLKDPVTAEQEAFLIEATSELARVGKLEPVQIALLSEMIKDKPWTPATLKSLGGIQGLGVSFLEERLAGTSAHPLLRTHIAIVRQILSEMLPADDTIIKPPACAQSVLIERLGGVASGDLICKLLNLLDTEVRLITPTSNVRSNSARSNSGSVSASSSVSSDPAYQLTHDYLVATTRKWLSSHDVETRSGRVRQQLREMSAAWNAMPTSKRLPAVLEWAAIRWFTSPKEWTQAERKMMRAVEYRLGQFAAAILVLLGSVAGVALWSRRELQSQSLAMQLVQADTGDVVSVLKAIAPYRDWVLPRLSTIEKTLENNDEQVATRRKLHVALARIDSDSSQIPTVIEHLSGIEDRHLAAIAKFISSTKTLSEEDLFQRLESATRNQDPVALPLAAVLVQRNPDHKAWDALAKGMCEMLVAKRSTHIGFWPELMMPIKTRLVSALIELEEQASAENKSVENHIALIAAFAAGDAISLGKAIASAPLDQVSQLLDGKLPRETLAIELREKLLNNSKTKGVVAKIPSPLSSMLTKVDGHLDAANGWACRVPWGELTGFLKELKASGYEPNSVRPYWLGGDQFAAVTCRKSNLETQLVTGLSKSSLESQFKELQERGASLIDFATYRSNNSQTTSNDKPTEDEQWLGLWQIPSGVTETSSQVLTLGVSNSELAEISSGFKETGYNPLRYLVQVDERGELLNSVIWSRSETERGEFGLWSRTEFASGDIYPGLYQGDLRCETIEGNLDRSEVWSDYHSFLISGDNNKKRPAVDYVNLAGRSSAGGMPSLALEWLAKSTEAEYARASDAVARGALRQYARAYARLGDAVKLREILDEKIATGKFEPSEKAYLYFRLAILEKAFEEARRLLTEIESTAGETGLTEDYYLRALATAAIQDNSDFESEAAFEKLLNRIPISQKNPKVKDLNTLLLETDFDGLRQRPKWLELLDSMKLSRRYASCNYYREGWTSKSIFGASLAEHQAQALQFQLDGFMPTSIHLHSNRKGGLVLDSIWERQEPTDSELAKSARRIATIALILARLGERDVMVEGLLGKWGRSVQTALITDAHKVLSSEIFIGMLREASQSSFQATLVSILGSYQPNQLNDVNFRYARARVDEWASSSNDAELANQSRWCLQSWGEAIVDFRPMGPQADRNWFVTKSGQQMILLDPPELMVQGEEAWRRWFKVDRQIALASTEVSGKQFAEFVKDPRVQKWMNDDRTERKMRAVSPELAQGGMSWQHAVRYCQWLNEVEGIPESEWCYRNVWNEEGQPILPEPDYLQRTGYRLPTEAEWVYACSAGSTETWHFGSDAKTADHYEWTVSNSGSQSHAPGLLRPNRFGFFDMGGNLAEWTDDCYSPPWRSDDQFFVLDKGNTATDDFSYNRLRDHRFNLSPQPSEIASKKRLSSFLLGSTGFRIARTMGKE